MSSALANKLLFLGSSFHFTTLKHVVDAVKIFLVPWTALGFAIGRIRHRLVASSHSRHASPPYHGRCCCCPPAPAACCVSQRRHAVLRAFCCLGCGLLWLLQGCCCLLVSHSPTSPANTAAATSSPQRLTVAIAAPAGHLPFSLRLASSRWSLLQPCGTWHRL